VGLGGAMVVSSWGNCHDAHEFELHIPDVFQMSAEQGKQQVHSNCLS